MYAGKAGAHPSEVPFRRSSYPQLLDEWIAKANTLAYYEHSKIMDVKSFVTFVPDQFSADLKSRKCLSGTNVKNFFTVVIYD
jgi:hypothetical protein